MEFSDRLKNLKKELDNAKINRAKAQTKLEELEKQEKAIHDEIRNLGIEPEDLEKSVEELKVEIETMLDKAEKEMREIDV